MIKKKQFIKFGAVVVLWIGFLVLVDIFVMRKALSRSVVIVSQLPSADTDKVYSSEKLAEFDGADDNKPIYIALNGFVYDVSAGREFYNLQGPYHYLAGKDSSNELNVIGGSIIKNKYPVVGKYVK